MELTTVPFVQPPAPLGSGSGVAGGFTASGLTNTELGDRVEAALIEQMSFKSALGGKRQGPIDVIAEGYAFEVKAVTRQAQEYKCKPKKHEVAEKLAAAESMGLDPAMVMVVVDGSEGWVYAREGIGAFRLTTKWSHLGTVTL